MASDPEDESAGERRFRARPRSMGELAGKLLARPLGSRGFVSQALVADWATIVGPALAAATLPLRIAFVRGGRSDGTLHLRVGSGAAALEVQHLAPLILERVNVHFGYRAVAQLALTQGPIPRRKPRPVPRARAPQPLDPALAGRIDSVADPELRAALARLGRRLAGESQRP